MNNKLVKVISANDQVFPQTVAEAVLVNGDQVTTLDKVLPKKIEQIIIICSIFCNVNMNIY